MLLLFVRPAGRVNAAKIKRLCRRSHVRAHQRPSNGVATAVSGVNYNIVNNLLLLLFIEKRVENAIARPTNGGNGWGRPQVCRI